MPRGPTRRILPCPRPAARATEAGCGFLHPADLHPRTGAHRLRLAGRKRAAAVLDRRLDRGLEVGRVVHSFIPLKIASGMLRITAITRHQTGFT